MFIKGDVIIQKLGLVVFNMVVVALKKPRGRRRKMAEKKYYVKLSLHRPHLVNYLHCGCG